MQIYENRLIKWGVLCVKIETFAIVCKVVDKRILQGDETTQ